MSGPTYQPVESPDATTVFPYHDLTPPTTKDVFRARRIVSKYLPKTPLVRSELLSEELDADVYLKREDTLPTGAFKVRGGITLGARLDDEFREQGLIAASTGNHGQSVAYAGREFGLPVTIAVPDDPNPGKVRSMERMGATVEERGEGYDAAREWAENQAAEKGYRYVHSANEPDLVAGVGTAGLEVLDELPDVDTVFCPVGGGSGAAGYCLTLGAISDARVVGVQAEGANAVYRGFHEGHLDPGDGTNTTAEGIASHVPFALTMEIMRGRLADLETVNDDEIWDAVVAMFREENITIEGASGAAIAAALRAGDDLAGQTVVVPTSGRNVAGDKLIRALEER
ncbi:threonine ammonia-lyase [Halorussus amylolyticus]|uniref:threonine ammonia-lyase n=1 Tax=Halorussus amylolyticus TaxID=1126242 RepID=UPI00104559AA|nr:pyridoxal-phosphate dependent enzyme [Halorussus amylolyticus]